MSRKRFTSDFKRAAVALVVVQNYSRQYTARNLSIGVSTLDGWLHAHRQREVAAAVANVRG